MDGSRATLERQGAARRSLEIHHAAGTLLARHERKDVHFFRHLPDRCNFMMAAGLRQTVDYPRSLHFDPEDIAPLRGSGLIVFSSVESLEDCRFSCNATAVGIFLLTGAIAGHRGAGVRTRESLGQAALQ